MIKLSKLQASRRSSAVLPVRSRLASVQSGMSCECDPESSRVRCVALRAREYQKGGHWPGSQPVRHMTDSAARIKDKGKPHLAGQYSAACALELDEQVECAVILHKCTYSAVPM